MNKRISNLDGLRFFAAFVVLIVHIQGIKKAFGIKFFDCRFIENSSHIAVTFFFVLSGFLITYFLLQRKENNTISIIKFYKRRILRIWPLYYLLLILTFFVFPHFHVFDFDAGGTPVNDHFIK
jgi:peptidoglycan/LPS O-acetylase OafA/YrhL